MGLGAVNQREQNQTKGSLSRMSSKAGRICAVMLLASTSCLVSPAFAQSYAVQNIAIDGNTRVGDGAILARAGLTPGQTISAGQLNDAYQKLQNSGLFESVKLEPRGSGIFIEVVERPTINRVSFEGNRKLKDDALKTLVSSAQRQVFNPSIAEADASKIAAAYNDSGRVAARITPRIVKRSRNRVDLVFEIFEGDVVEVERISIVGNREFSDARLRRVLNTKQAGIFRAFVNKDTFVEDRIEFDKQVMRDFYFSRGYVDFRVNSANAQLAQERDGHFISFNVHEGQQFTFGNITTVSEIESIDAEEYHNVMKIKSGATYSPTLVEREISRLERLSLRRGVDFLRVEPRITRNDRDLTLDIEFVLSRGPKVFAERIDIEGNTTTLDRVIRRQFTTVEGDPFNPRAIREAAERIRALGYFANAEVNAREGSSPDQVVLDVDVEEKPTGSLSFGGAFSATSGFGIQLKLNEKNFLGRGQEVNLTYSTASEQKSYGLQFIEPAFLGRNVQFAFNLASNGNTSQFTTYQYDQLVFEPSLTFPISENGRLQLRYTFDQVEMDYADTSNTAATGTVITNDINAGKRKNSSLGYTYTYDTRITGLNPDAGLLFQFGQDFGGIGGDNKFIKTKAKVIGQRQLLNRDIVLRATLEAGALTYQSGINRATDRFLLNQSILRGFEPGGIGPREEVTGDALGGNYFVAARVEAEFPMGLPEEYGIRGALFYDVGNLWDLSDVNIGSARVEGESGSLRQAVGFGILWATPIGPLRFNFTKALKKETFDRDQSFDLTLSASF